MKLYCEDNHKWFGTVGDKTMLKDNTGTALFVGDVVILKRRDRKWSKMRFVAWYEDLNVPYIILWEIILSCQNMTIVLWQDIPCLRRVSESEMYVIRKNNFYIRRKRRI